MTHHRAICAAALLLAGALAQAIPVPLIWFTEDFNRYPDGAPLPIVPGWDGVTQSELRIFPFDPTNGGLYPEYAEPGNKAVRMRGANSDGSLDYSHAWFGSEWMQQSAGALGIITFDLQAQLGALNPDRGDHFLIDISDQNDQRIGSVNGWSSEVKLKDSSGAIVSQITMADGDRYNYAFIVDPATGLVEYLLNGNVVGSQNTGVGRSLGWIYIKTWGGAVTDRDTVWFDNLLVGTVPEATSLVMLWFGGLLILRRRVR